ncbi:Senescence domain-containing protein [Ceratobasidium sp. AG-Ba]|nr:Senescence domain-containing protein [Ceratobasidium sp. AG-Ba]QRW15421.1 Senescence domain-containing protein [Ceratobasidium sp. AG-Ba]
MAGAEGFLLLTIPNCTLKTQDGASQSGVLALECVTIPLRGPQTAFSGAAPEVNNERDVWLVLRLNTFETIISPTQTIHYTRAQHQFAIPAEDGGVVTLTVPQPMTAAAVEDLESLEVLLSQYGIIQETGASSAASKGTGDTKGRLVLVDEDNGAMLGTLGDQFQIREDPNLVSRGHEKDPVVIEIPERGEQVFVHNIAPDEQDWMLRSAGYISRGILYATDMATKGMQSAAQRYVANNSPTTTPIVFSETTNANMRRVHNLSGQAVKVTARTTGMIHKMIDAGIDRMSKPKPKETDRSGAPNTPPRPPRLLNRLLISTDLLLTTLEQSAHQLVTHGTDAASTVAGHRYGPDVGASTKSMGETVRNVGVVYIDARGVGRRALIKRAGKRMIKGRLGGGKEIVLGDETTAGGVGQLHVSPTDDKPAGPSRPGSSMTAGVSSKSWS